MNTKITLETNNKYVCYCKDTNKISNDNEHIVFNIKTDSVLDIICRLHNIVDDEKIIFNYIINGIDNISKLCKLYCDITKKSYSTFLRNFNKLKSRGVFYIIDNTIFINSKYKFNDLNIHNCKHIILNIIKPS